MISDAEMTEGLRLAAAAIADAASESKKLASWYGLLARAANIGIVDWCEVEGFISVDDDCDDPGFDDNGLPIETPERRQAIERALSESQEPQS